MNTKPLFTPLFLSAAVAVSAQFAPATAQADILSVTPHAKVLKKANMPKQGQSMRAVSNKFGKAKSIKVSKGAITKRNPKITQWVYSGFSVYFENSHVIHSVIRR